MTKTQVTLYHNSRCSKSRAVLEILEKSQVAFKIVEYLVTPPSEAILEALLKQLKMEPDQIIRKTEDEYEDLKAKDSLPTSRLEWIQLMVQYPILIERPIVSNGLTAVVGRPPEKVSEWLTRECK